jgi:hypothetical protein
MFAGNNKTMQEQETKITLQDMRRDLADIMSHQILDLTYDNMVENAELLLNTPVYDDGKIIGYLTRVEPDASKRVLNITVEVKQPLPRINTLCSVSYEGLPLTTL